MLILDNTYDLNSKGIKADIAYKRLKEIEEMWKCITPKLVIDDAINPESPLHDCFEWNDTAAARKWRERQARSLIKSVHIIKSDKKHGEIKVRCFVSVSNVEKYVFNIPGVEENRVYKDIEIVFKNEDEKQDVLARALKEISLWKTRYRHLKEFEKIVEEIDKVLA